MVGFGLPPLVFDGHEYGVDLGEDVRVLRLDDPTPILLRALVENLETDLFDRYVVGLAPRLGLTIQTHRRRSQRFRSSLDIRDPAPETLLRPTQWQGQTLPNPFHWNVFKQGFESEVRVGADD